MIRSRPRGLVSPALALLALLALAPGELPAAGPDKAAEPAKTAVPEKAPESAPAPATIPIPEVAQRADDALAIIRETEALAAASPDVETIQQKLPQAAVSVSEQTTATQRLLEGQPSINALDAEADVWRKARIELGAWVDALARRATQLEAALTRLADLREAWTRARVDARASKAPAPVVERIDFVLAAITGARTKLERERTAILLLQDQVARGVGRVDEALTSLAQARRRAAAEMWVRDSPPIWSPELYSFGGPETRAQIGIAIQAARDQILGFARERASTILAQFALFLVLVPLLGVARRRARSAEAPDPSTGPLVDVLHHPVAGAVVLTLVTSIWLYPKEAPAVHTMVGIITLVSMVVIMRHLVPAPATPGLYAAGGVFLADRVRGLAQVEPVLEQQILLAETLATAVVLALAIASRRGREMAARYHASRLMRAFALGGRLGLAAAGVAFASAAVGNVSLARVLGTTVINSTYLALVLYTAVRVADALVAFLLRARPFVLLQSVRRHRALIERRAHAVFGWGAAIAWALLTARLVGVLGGVGAAARAVLDAGVTRGSVITLGDVLAFVLTVYLAYLVSRFLRFVLAEDVYPRLALPDGLPYAVSSVLNYAILFLGFLFALAALGLDANRVTLLGGAVGVGIGFGLQNVVNNFVSGIIVLFERPIRVGDIVQTANLTGEVRRIGMRSTTVRTGEGAEVVVPNALLIAERVTNWTLSDRTRRVDLPLGVAYGTAPDTVIDLLCRVARNHRDVLTSPEPMALFLGFGDSALRFELRVWTGQVERSAIVQSELGVAAYAALREAGIAIPFPQTDVHLRPEPPA